MLIGVTHEEPGILKDLFGRTPMLSPVGDASTLATCHHKHEYVTKQVDHGVTEMILQEVQFWSVLS